MNSSGTYKIRPAGRHLITIGEDLIQDKCAAILELVKNSYDADSPDVKICFHVNESRDRLTIVVEDHGHGMTFEDVTDKWMVPSTDDKVKRRKSPSGRIMQGRKGIGRYAANILGNNLLLESVDRNSNKTTLFIEWQQFTTAKYLDEVEILIESKKTSDVSGTKLTIESSVKHIEEWNKQINKLRFELKKLIPPDVPVEAKSEFKIFLVLDNLLLEQEDIITEEIMPYPILDFFDYRINGHINENGNGRLQYINQKARNTLVEEIPVSIGPTYCGALLVDIRVYDREKESIEALIARGLKDEVSGQYLKNLETRQLLNSLNGIGVYRNGFRIRPLGDPEFDWLKLNEQRVQNPSQKIGSNQVIGYVHIESEEKSGLEETSARDGLKDNLAYDKLKEITCYIISKLEVRRFTYRRNAGLSRPAIKVEKELEKLYDYSILQKSISTVLKKSGLSDPTIDEISQIIDKEQNTKNAIVDDIKTTVAIYQGQATLGKIINVILHEGRRPLNYFKNQIPNLNYYGKTFKESATKEHLEKILNLTDGIEENASVFVKLFGRLDPLASKKRETRSEFNLYQSIIIVSHVFENELALNSIELNITGDQSLILNGWRQDMYTIFTNLVDNSIFWMVHAGSSTKKIVITIQNEGSSWYIDYKDSGPGIEPELLQDGVIFEPEFTTKPKGTGTGLGLAIAGEAAQRNGLELRALQNTEGAHFKLYPL